jgi:hypothetical protein
MEVLAQAAAAPATDWTQLAITQGPLTVLFLVGLYFLIVYGPGLFNGHRVMMEKLGDSGEKTADCLQTLTDVQERQSRSLLHLVSAGEEITTCPKAKAHLRRARRELDASDEE